MLDAALLWPYGPPKLGYRLIEIMVHKTHGRVRTLCGSSKLNAKLFNALLDAMCY